VKNYDNKLTYVEVMSEDIWV